MKLSKETNKLFIQGVDVLSKREENPIGRIRCMLKNYLELDNVNFLFGTGSSITIGARSIQSIPLSIEESIKNENPQEEGGKEKNALYDEFITIIINYNSKMMIVNFRNYIQFIFLSLYQQLKCSL